MFVLGVIAVHASACLLPDGTSDVLGGTTAATTTVAEPQEPSSTQGESLPTVNINDWDFISASKYICEQGFITVSGSDCPTESSSSSSSGFSLDLSSLAGGGTPGDGIVRLQTVDQTDNNDSDDSEGTYGFQSGNFDTNGGDPETFKLEYSSTNFVQIRKTSEDPNPAQYDNNSTTPTFQSRVIDGGGELLWTASTIRWVPKAPYSKPLPSAGVSETGYEEGNANMTSNVLLYHMSEASWDGTADEVVDSSGQNNHSARAGMATTATTGGRFGGGGTFTPGNSDHVPLPNAVEVATNVRTIELWYKADDLAIANKQVLFEYGDQNEGFSIYINTDDTVSAGAYSAGALGTDKFITTTATTNTTNWHHVALVLNYDGSDNSLRFYYDGIEVGSVTSIGSGVGTPGTGDGAIGAMLSNGRYHDGTAAASENYFDGNVDEVGVYDRALSATEVLDRYKRGILNIRFQVRTCSAVCDSEDYVGPDNTTATYFDETANTGVTIPTNQSFTATNNRYIQYRAVFSTEQPGDGTIAGYTPELSSVIIGPDHYYAGNPTIRNATGLTYTELLSTSFFVQTSGADDSGGSALIRYQFSNDGTTWYWYTNGAWTQASASYDEANNVADALNNIKTFDDTVGTGRFFFKAYIPSSLGQVEVELDKVTLWLYAN